jgi:hypothetical protein
MAKKRRKRRKTLNSLEIKIPFNRSVRRKVVIEFGNICDEIGVDQAPMLEEILLTFIKDYRKPK